MIDLNPGDIISLYSKVLGSKLYTSLVLKKWIETRHDNFNKNKVMYALLTGFAYDLRCSGEIREISGPSLECYNIEKITT